MFSSTRGKLGNTVFSAVCPTVMVKSVRLQGLLGKTRYVYKNLNYEL